MQDQTLVERDKAEHDASWYVPDLYAKKNNNHLFSFFFVPPPFSHHFLPRFVEASNLDKAAVIFTWNGLSASFRCFVVESPSDYTEVFGLIELLRFKWFERTSLFGRIDW